jgi:transcriptional regulator GlxA family with amidase domain
VCSVCTGSGILAKAGLLDGLKATSNKRAFGWARSQGPNVAWIREARWVDEGHRATSSGVTAGMDMALALIERLLGKETADAVADGTEYLRSTDPNRDPFA